MTKPCLLCLLATSLGSQLGKVRRKFGKVRKLIKVKVKPWSSRALNASSTPCQLRHVKSCRMVYTFSAYSLHMLCLFARVSQYFYTPCLHILCVLIDWFERHKDFAYLHHTSPTYTWFINRLTRGRTFLIYTHFHYCLAWQDESEWDKRRCIKMI